MNKNDYARLTDIKTKNSPIFKDCCFAFLIGGAICCVGQVLTDLYANVAGFSAEDASTLTSVTLVFLSALFTGIGLYQKLARIAGAGTLVPIPGFANAVVSPALEFKSEGSILGTGVKLFSIAGPVIVYGTAASVVYGIIYYIVKLVCDV